MEVTSAFPGGNGLVLGVEDSSGGSVVRFIAEPRTSAESLYWRLRLTGTAGRSVTFHWSQCQNCLGTGNAERLRPVWRDGNGPWQRVPTADRADEPLGATALRWTLPFRSDTAEVAFIFPYEKEQLEAALAANRRWQRHVIGATGQSRPLEALSLGAFPAKRGLFLVTRQHCSETTGPWVLDGILRAADERPDFCVLAVPAVDLDGALAGDYGKDKPPRDFNRAWSNVVAMRPETLAIRRLMQRWSKSGARPLAIDLHSPGASENDGPYFFCGRATMAQAAVLNPFFDACHALLPEELRGPREKFIRMGDYPTRWPHELGFGENTRVELDWPATSMETPYQGNGARYYSIADYQAVGRAVWQAAVKAVEQKG